MIEKVSLFKTKRDYLYFFLLSFLLLCISLGIEYYNFKQLTQFDSQLVNATVLKQYSKTKIRNNKLKYYQVLKLKSSDGFTFYSTTSTNQKDIKFKHIELEIWAGKISFYEYLHGFYAFSTILQVYNDTSYKTLLSDYINVQHNDENATLVYQALFIAKQLPFELQKVFSNLGVSHLIAISGFHLGVLSGILFFLLKYPYQFLQRRYFTYRSYKRDSFFIISLVLFAYLLFLDIPPSLLRAFVMLIFGFMLYDRGIKVISMQTLFMSVIIILSLFPRLFFSIGLWLSVAGVFYIFLFLIYFKERSKLWQFGVLPFWVYLLMLPYSLAIFTNFSLLHPLSILWTSLFSLFYPLVMFLHIFGFGNLLDGVLLWLINLDTNSVSIELDVKFLYAQILLSLLSIYKKNFLLGLVVYTLSIFIYAIYCVT